MGQAVNSIRTTQLQYSCVAQVMSAAGCWSVHGSSGQFHQDHDATALLRCSGCECSGLLVSSWVKQSTPTGLCSNSTPTSAQGSAVGRWSVHGSSGQFHQGHDATALLRCSGCECSGLLVSSWVKQSTPTGLCSNSTPTSAQGSAVGRWSVHGSSGQFHQGHDATALLRCSGFECSGPLVSSWVKRSTIPSVPCGNSTPALLTS